MSSIAIAMENWATITDQDYLASEGNGLGGPTRLQIGQVQLNSQLITPSLGYPIQSFG